MPYSVQQQDHTRKEAVQKLIHQFETHPNREALRADLKQNHAFNPFREQSKEVIYSMGNMENFEICEITPKVQCHNCVTYWTKGIVFCTCGTCLRPSDRIRKLNKDRFDVLSIPNYVIKKGPSHGARHGNTERQIIYHAAHVSAKKALKKGYKSILDRFLGCLRYRQSQINIGWDGEHCARCDAIAADIATASERFRRENDWVRALNSSGLNGPMNQREDYHEAINIKERLYEESGKGNTRLHPSEHVRQRPGQPFSWHSEGSERVDPKNGWRWYTSNPPANSSSSGWQPSSWWQASSWDEQ